MLQDKKNIKICFVCPKAYPIFVPEIEAVFGGAEVDLYMLATELAKDDSFDVSIITADYGQPPEQMIENVRVIKSLNFKQNPLTGVIKIWKAFKKANADIYMIKTASPGVPLTAAFCKIHKKIFIYRIAHRHECDGTYLENHKIFGRAFARSLSTAKMIFSQNRDDADLLQETLKLNSIVVPNGHRSAKDSDYQREYILWVGRGADFKKPYKFLELAKELPREKFLMICQQATDGIDYQKLRFAAERIANLEFIQRVPFGQIDEYFQKAKVFINTSDSEGFPNTFIQACKTATPILSLNVNPDGFLDEFGCGVCCNRDFKELSKQIKILLSSALIDTMANNARLYFKKKHDISVIAEEYKTFFGKFTTESKE